VGSKPIVHECQANEPPSEAFRFPYAVFNNVGRNQINVHNYLTVIIKPTIVIDSKGVVNPAAVQVQVDPMMVTVDSTATVDPTNAIDPTVVVQVDPTVAVTVHQTVPPSIFFCLAIFMAGAGFAT
jgi:hypothetical protein